MISRLRYTAERLNEHKKYLSYEKEKIVHIMETNFDMIDCVHSIDILQECAQYRTLDADKVLFNNDNNDGINL